MQHARERRHVGGEKQEAGAEAYGQPDIEVARHGIAQQARARAPHGEDVPELGEGER